MLRQCSGVFPEDIAKKFQRLDFQALAGNEDRVQDGRSLSCLRMPYEEPVLLADRHRPDRILHGVVVDRKLAMIQVGREIVPVLELVVAGFAEFAFR